MAITYAQVNDKADDGHIHIHTHMHSLLFFLLLILLVELGISEHK